MADVWKKCTACKNDIRFGQAHWVCSVSTCNRSNTGYKFCTVSCWDSHVAQLNHRDAWAVEARAPREGEEAPLAPAAPAPPAAPRRIVDAPSAPVGGPKLSDDVERDVLIVVSKMKKYIKDRSGFNCGDAVVDLLSDHVRAVCDEAIRAAARDERKTVLERDIPRPKR